ncbi:hypothetical protein ATCC90586_009889 [Pythium insidiosum]|nr:hypothetical protein ATCC90586_009889 [Pythium insidiosum]
MTTATPPPSYGAADGPAPKAKAKAPRSTGDIRHAQRPQAGETDYLFKYLILTQVWMYLEAGAVPSLLEQFTRTYRLDPQEQGLLGAVVYISISIASPWCSTLFRRFCARRVLGISLLVNNLALLCFALVPTLKWYSKPLLVLMRSMIGFTQAFHCVYSPLWVHEYAPKAKKGTWMSFLQAAVPFGITLGYFAGSVTAWAASPVPSADAPPLIDMGNATLAAALASTTSASVQAVGADLLSATTPSDIGVCHGIYCWRWPFLFQFVMVLPLSILIFFVPRSQIEIHDAQPLMLLTGDEDESSGSAVDETSHLTASGRPAESDVWENLRELFEHKVYVCIVLGLSALFFVVAGVQFWTTLYLSTNTDDSMYEIHLSYLLVAGTGPILGVFFGGWLIDRAGGYSGPYQQAKALRICMVLGLAGCLASIPVSFVHSTFAIAFFLWSMLFCGGCLLPACSGIVISSAPRRLRPLASSVAYTSYNLLGYAASNYIPGLIMNLIIHNRGDGADACDIACTYRVGFRIVLFWSVWAFCCLIGGTYFSELNRIKAEDEERRTGRRPPSGSIA